MTALLRFFLTLLLLLPAAALTGCPVDDDDDSSASDDDDVTGDDDDATGDDDDATGDDDDATGDDDDATGDDDDATGDDDDSAGDDDDATGDDDDSAGDDDDATGDDDDSAGDDDDSAGDDDDSAGDDDDSAGDDDDSAGDDDDSAGDDDDSAGDDDDSAGDDDDSAGDDDDSAGDDDDSAVAGIPEVFISEVADPGDVANAKFVELYNAGSDPVDLSGWIIRRWANGSSTSSATAPLNGTLQPGDVYVVAGNQGTFDSTYGPNIADSYSGSISGNGDDVYELEDTIGVIDIYGEVGVDGTGTAWEYTNSIVVRNAGQAGPNDVFDINEWTITSPGNATNGSPGIHSN